ncbi:MAG: subclass B1 metallo-beta-lactamase [Bacteroidales bacterium]|nr:subclass B1 metallo-beta-lactamase [Bacteroidales bacterium]
MKILFVALFTLLFQQSGFSQSTNKLIRISADIELIQITENAFIHVSYTNTSQWGRLGANGLIFTDKKQAFLFDSPWTNEQTEDLLAWLRDSMGLEIAGFVPNHWHEDCMGGLECIHKHGIKSYANQLTIEIAKNKGLQLPENGFNDSLTLYLGEKRIECYYPGAAHSTDNIVVWIPSEQILFPACMVKDMRTRSLGNTTDGDLISYPKTLTKVLYKFPSAKIVIPGHGNYGGMELLKHSLELAGN